MSEIIDEDEQQLSGISVSAWDHKKQRSFIICGQAKRAEEMEVGIQEESDITEEKISENDISDKEDINPAKMIARHMMPSRNRGRRGRGGHVVDRERENIKPAGRGRGACRGGFGSIKRSPKKDSSVLKDSKTRNYSDTGSDISEIGQDFSSLSVSQTKSDNDRTAFTTTKKHENNQSGTTSSPKKYEYTHDNMRDTSINDCQSVDNCSNIGQYDAESETESSVSIMESNHGQHQTYALSESVMSYRDNFLYEESIDGRSVDLSETASQTVKNSNLMPSRKKAREKKIALYKEAARIAKLQEEYEQETLRQSNRDELAELPVKYKEREIRKDKSKKKKFITVEKDLSGTDEEEFEIVEPIMSTYRNGGNTFTNNYQTTKREPKLLPAYQELLNEYTKAVTILSYVEKRREERSHLNKSAHIEKVQRSIEGFKWRLYEEQQTFYQAPKLNYGPSINIDDFNTKQSTEKRKKLYKTQKQFKVNIRTVFESSQQPFRINLKDVGEFDIVFFRKNINDEEYITFSVDPFYNFTGKTQIGMEIVPSDKFRGKKKTTRQFVFGNEKTNPWPMNRIYIDESFRKCYLEDNKHFTANIYIISCEVYLSPCIRIVRLLQESQASLRQNMKEYIAFVNKPKDYNHRGISDFESEKTIEEDF